MKKIVKMQPTLCFLCRSDSVPPISKDLSNCGRILLEIVATFCNCMRINVCTFQRFGKLWFPFCEECRLGLMHLHRLNCDIEKLQRSTRQGTTQICAKVISSTSAEDSVGISMVNRSSQKQDQLDLIQSFRNDIVRSYCPTVNLRKLGFSKVLDEPIAVEVITSPEDFVDTAADATGGSENLNDHDAHLLDTSENVASLEASNNFHNDNTLPEHHENEFAVAVDQPSSHVEMININSQIAEKTAEESVPKATSGEKKPRRKRKKRRDREPIVYRKPEHTPDELEKVSDTEILYRKIFLLKKVAGSYATYICPICDIIPRSLDDVIRHIRRSHLGEVPNQRGMIKMLEIAPNVWDYGGFTATKTPDGRYKCNTCAFLTHTRNYARVHLRDRHLLKVRPECRLAKPWYFCDLCGNGKRFAQQKMLEAHIATHSTIKDKKCDLCEKTFKTSVALYQHKHSVHGKDSDTIFECENCKKQIKGIHKFKIHGKRCTSKKDFICDICQKKYNSMPGLEHHMDHHKGTKYLCDYCGMDFAQQASLDRHKRNIHKVKAEKPNSSTNVEDG